MMVAKEWLVSEVRTGFGTGQVMGLPALETGRDWLHLFGINETFKFDEKPKNTKAGDYIENSFSFVNNKMDAFFRSATPYYLKHEWVTVLGFIDGSSIILGNQRKAMSFRFNRTHENKPGTEINAFELTLDTVDPAPFISI
jgi:hypothetical protein